MNHYKAHIAVINDDPVFLGLMNELLESEEGYRVSTCRHGDEAYQFVKDAHPDLVILDILFGSLDAGMRMLELLTLDPQTRPIPVIVCSAADHILNDREDWLRQFDVEVLPKPFDLDVLLQTIEMALNRQRAPQN